MTEAIFLTDTAWDRFTINRNNKPELTGAFIAVLGPVEDNTWIEVDVTSIVTTNGDYSWGILNDSSNSVFYSLIEGVNPSELVVLTQDMEPPDTMFTASPTEKGSPR